MRLTVRVRTVMRSRSFDSQEALFFATIFCCVTCVLALEINLISAVVLVFSLALITQFGRVVGMWVGELGLGLGLGFIVGVSFFVFGGQVLLSLGIPPRVAHWCVLLVMAVAIGMIRLRHAESYRAVVEISFRDSITALSITMLVISTRQGWLFALAIPLVALERLSWSKCRWSTKALVALVSLPLGGLLSQHFQSGNWWQFYQGNDSQFFEAISWSTAEWGVVEHPGFVGGSTLAYHWFGYTFLGGLSHVASLAPWDALMKLGVPLTLFFFINLVIAEPDQSRGRLNYTVWIFVFIVASATFGSRFDSYGFSILIAMGFIQLVDKIDFRVFTPKMGLLVGICAFELVLSKVSTSIVVVAYLTLVLCARRIRHERVSWLPLALLIAAIGTCYLLLFRNLSDTGILQFSPSIEGSVIELRNLLETPAFPTSLFVWLSSLVLLWRHIRLSDVRLFVLLLLVPAGLTFQVLQANSFSAYLGMPATHILSFLLVRRLHADLNVSQNHKFREITVTSSLLIGTGILVGYFYFRYVSHLISSVDVASWIRREFWLSVLLGSGYVFGSIMLLVFAFFVYDLNRRYMVLMIALSLAAVTVGSRISSYKQQLSLGPSSYTTWSGNSAPFATPDLVALGKFVRSSTESSAVLATNNFCCAGQIWWNVITDDLDYHNLSASGEMKWGGANYLLPAETRRRFLINGLRFQTGSSLPTSEQIRRMSLSLSFANNPTARIAGDLRSYGVSGYIVNLALTSRQDWSEFAVEKFRNGNFVFLELKN